MTEYDKELQNGAPEHEKAILPLEEKTTRPDDRQERRGHSRRSEPRDDERQAPSR